LKRIDRIGAIRNAIHLREQRRHAFSDAWCLRGLVDQVVEGAVKDCRFGQAGSSSTLSITARSAMCRRMT
jgi:hypothetical protein